MKVVLRNPARELHVQGPIQVLSLLDQLAIQRETVLVIRDGELVPADARLDDDAVVEIRSVISGGAE